MRDTSQLDPDCDPSTTTCEEKDLPCASDRAIDSWLETKKGVFQVINNKVDFGDSGNGIVR